MPFFGPGGLSGYQPSTTPSGLDPQFLQQLVQAFPGLQQMSGQGQQQPQSLQTLGYQWGGPQLYQGQGTGSFQLSPFEGAKGFGAESITGGLASGTFGKSSSQGPMQGAPAQGGLLSLPSLQLPQAVAFQQAAAGGGEEFGPTGEAAPESSGISLNAGDLLGGVQKAADLFAPGVGTAYDPSGQTQTPAYQAQRAGERDLSTLGGSFLQGLQGNQLLSQPAPISSFLGLPSDTTFSALQGGDLLTPPSSQFAMAPGTTFSMPDAGETMMAPGGSAQQALGQPAPQGDLLGGGLSALQGLYNLYSGAQTGNPGQLLGGLSGTLGGASQLAPETMAALSQQLGLGAGGLGLAGAGLGGLAGGYGLYQGISQGDPLQALMGAAGLYSGAAPLINSAFGTGLPTLSSLGGQALSAIAPELAASLGIGAGTGAAGAAGVAGGAAAGAGGAASGVGAAAGAGLGAAAGVAAPIIAAIISYISANEEENARRSGWWNNPIKGGLYSNATAGVANSQAILNQLAAGGNIADVPTYALGASLSDAVNSLMPYYATGQGGKGAIRASESAGSPGLQSKDEYTANFSRAQQGVADLVKELQNRGLTYQQLGALPGISGDWASRSLDAGGTPEEYLQISPRAGEFSREASGLFGQLGMNPFSGAAEAGAPERALDTGEWQGTQTKNWDQQIQEVLARSLGASMEGPAEVTKASELMTNMYGGPLWAAMARMGAPGFAGPGGVISQNFDPWVTARDPAFQQAWTQPQLTQGDLDRYMAQHGVPYQAPAAPTRMDPMAAGNQYWADQRGQYLQQQAQQDPVTQQLQQYIQQMSGLTQQAPQLLQAAQTSLQGAPISNVLPQQPGAPGFTSSAPGGGMDLMALLRQLGYVQ